MLHAAIHRTPPGAIIVVEAGDVTYAVAGGNVCAVAQRRGIAGFIVDGVIRDLAEARRLGFPVFARGVSPIPGGKAALGIFNVPVRCGGVRVAPRDMLVADEEGIVVVPAGQSADLLARAQAKAARDAAETLDAWKTSHGSRIDEILRRKGFVG